jgi:hypothetical protein
MSRRLTAGIAGVVTFCVHSIVEWLSWASHSGQAVPGPSRWDLVWTVASVPTFTLLPETVINTSFEALLLLNSIGWSLVSGLLVYVLKGRSLKAG